MKSVQLTILICMATISLVSCKRNVASLLDIAGTTEMANLKVIHASAYNTNYTVQLKINNQRLSNNIIYTTPFPGGGLNTQGSNMPWYLSLAPGPTYITLSMPKTGSNEDSVVLASRTITTEANKYFSVYLTDTAANTQAVLISENVTEPDDNTSRFKFVNLIPNQAFVDLYLGSTKVASNIAYKSVSPEFVLPRGGTAVWSIRAAGAAPTSTALATYTQSGGIPNKRIMTVYSRGYAGQTTGNRVPAISLLYN